MSEILFPEPEEPDAVALVARGRARDRVGRAAPAAPVSAALCRCSHRWEQHDDYGCHAHEGGERCPCGSYRRDLDSDEIVAVHSASGKPRHVRAEHRDRAVGGVPVPRLHVVRDHSSATAGERVPARGAGPSGPRPLRLRAADVGRRVPAVVHPVRLSVVSR